MNYRSGDGYDGEGFNEDSYEAQLRDYQRGRNPVSYSPTERSQERTGSPPFNRPSSPSFERQSRLDNYYSEVKYSNKLRDSDSQSGDRDSVRSFRSIRSESRRDSHFEEKIGRDRYYEEYDKRPHSPASSEYSQKSKSSPIRIRSRSPSPVVSHKLKKRDKLRAQSPISSVDYSYRDGSRPASTSPMDYDTSRDYTKYKKSEKERIRTDSDTGSTRSKSKRSSRHSDSSDVERRKSTKPRAYQSDNENSDTERSVKSEVRSKRRSTDMPKKEKITLAEYKKMDRYPKSSVVSTVTKVKRRESTEKRSPKSEKDIHWNTMEPGYHEHLSKESEPAIPKSYVTKVTTPEYSRTVERDNRPKSPSDSSVSASSGKPDSDPESVPETETIQSSLEFKRQQLLEQLKSLEEGGSTSDNESGSIPDEDRKKPRLEDVFDLKHFEQVPPKDLSKGATVPSSSESGQNMDTLNKQKGYRKQMELQRKIEQKRKVDVSTPNETPVTVTAPISVVKTEPTIPGGPTQYEEEIFDLSAEKSPTEIPSEFLARKRKQCDISNEMDLLSKKKSRSYRVKSEHMFSPSSGDESDNEKTGQGKAMKPPPAPVPPVPDNILGPVSTNFLVDPLGKRTYNDTGQDPSSGTLNNSPPKPVPPPEPLDKYDPLGNNHDSTTILEPKINDNIQPKNESFQNEDLGKTPGRVPFEGKSGSALGVDRPSDIDSPTGIKCTLETKPDAWKPREISHSPTEKFTMPEPRTIPSEKREGPMSLPLPKFARQATFAMSPRASPKASPKQLPSPKHSSPLVTKLQSPPFSPNHSAQASPVWNKQEAELREPKLVGNTNQNTNFHNF